MPFVIKHLPVSTLGTLVAYPDAYNAVRSSLQGQLAELQEKEIRRAYQDYVQAPAAKGSFTDDDFEIGPENYFKNLGFDTVEAYRAFRNKILNLNYYAQRGKARDKRVQQYQDRYYQPQHDDSSEPPTIFEKAWRVIWQFSLETALLFTGVNVYRGLFSLFIDVRKPVSWGLKMFALIMMILGAIITPLALVMRIFETAWLNLSTDKGRDQVLIPIKDDNPDDFYLNMIRAFSVLMGLAMIALSGLLLGTLWPGFSNMIGQGTLSLIPEMGEVILAWTVGEHTALLGGLVAVFAIPAFAAATSALYAGFVYVYETVSDGYRAILPSEEKDRIYYYDPDLVVAQEGEAQQSNQKDEGSGLGRYTPKFDEQKQQQPQQQEQNQPKIYDKLNK